MERSSMSDEEFRTQMEQLLEQGEDEFTQQVVMDMAAEITDHMDDEVCHVVDPISGVEVDVSEKQAFMLMMALARYFNFSGHMSTKHDFVAHLNKIFEVNGVDRRINYGGFTMGLIEEDLSDSWMWQSGDVDSMFNDFRMSLVGMEAGFLPTDVEALAEAAARFMQELLDTFLDHMKAKEKKKESERFTEMSPYETLVQHPESVEAREVIEVLPELTADYGIECDIERTKVDPQYSYDLLCECMAKAHNITAAQVDEMYRMRGES
jgi:hypothetical protein